MKVVILCGGRGTRLKEETEFRPKPMVEIGGKPVLWHIMKIYAHYGFNEFILCLGYKGQMIKEYFLNYQAMNNDFTVKLSRHNQIEFHNNHDEHDWTVTLADTGEETPTGDRIRSVEKYVDGDAFMATYGDGVGNINLRQLLAFAKKQKTIGVITGVRPSSRFGELVVKNGKVLHFREKPQVDEGLVNGGFFVFRKEFFRYLKSYTNCPLEALPLEQLTRDKQLSVFCHRDFWQCVDTYRELDLLNQLWKSKNPPWKVWKK